MTRSRKPAPEEKKTMTRTGSPVAGKATFNEIITRLRGAQKRARGGPPYSLFVNRPLGRVFAALAYRAGLTPNQVTALSALFTFVGIGVLALAPATWGTGVAVAPCLIIGYALDSADGQLARLRGGGSLLGEWLDHTVDSIKVGAVHLAVLITWFRHFDLDVRWMLVPLAFALVSQVHFFGMILVDLLARARRAGIGLPPPPRATVQLSRTLAKLPTDYGVFCLAIVLLGAHNVFVAVYTLLAVATVGYTLLVMSKWRRDVIALDSLQPAPARPAD